MSCRSAKDLKETIDNKLNEIVESPKKFLNHGFMMNIYADERNQMTAFDEYMSYMFEYKQTLSPDNESKFVRLDQDMIKEALCYRGLGVNL